MRAGITRVATYAVTSANWNDPAFWSSVKEAGAGHTFDFSALSSKISVDWDPALNRIVLSDGSTAFTVGDAGYGGGANATLGGATLFSFFTTLFGSDGNDVASGSAAGDALSGGGGNDTLLGLAGDDSIAGGAGDDSLSGGDDADTFLVEDGFGADTIDGGLGGTDDDLIDFSEITSGVKVTYSGDQAGTATDGTDTLSFSEIEHVITSEQADRINAGPNNLDGSYETRGGDDYISTDSGDDTVDAGDGDDTILTSFGDDSVVAGAGADSISSGYGADTVFAGAGDDTLWVSRSDFDYVDGGADSDLIYVVSDFGDDTVYGGEGGTDVDTLDFYFFDYLPASISVTFAGDEDGTFTDPFATAVFYEIEALRMTGQDDAVDTSAATSGKVIEGLGGNDTLVGGAGDDTLVGGDGADSMLGNAGSERFMISDTFGADTISGGAGGTDRDRLDFSGMAATGVSVTYSAAEAGSATDGTDTLTFSDIESVSLSDQADTVDATSDTAGVDVDGGGGNDSLTGGTGADTLLGGDGDDSIAGGDGADFLKTGQGQDTLDGGAGDDTLMNAAGDDSLVGGTGDDLLVATQGNDTLEGGAGFDTLMGGTGGDSLDGGADNDLLLGDLAGVAFNATGTDGVGLASNITDFPSTQLSYEITFSSTTTTGNAVFGSYAGATGTNEFLIEESGGQLRLHFDGTSVLTGVSTAPFYDGAVHTLAVTWNSTTGVVELYFDGASAYTGTIATGASLDQNGTFALGQEQDAIGGGFDSNQIFQGEIYGVRLYDDVRTPAEILDSTHGPVADTSDPNLIANWVADPDAATFTDQTGSHAMTMSGDVLATWSSGADTLRGGTGNDTLYGGGGADAFIVENGFGNDTIVGGEAGNDSDTIDASALTGAVTVTFTGDEAGTITDGIDTITFSEIENVVTGGGDDTIDASADSSGVGLFTNDGQDTIVGGTGADTIRAGAGNDQISDGEGDDDVDAGDGNDTIGGWYGNDTLRGGAGDDRIEGGDGADSIEGGTGADLLVGYNANGLATGSTAVDTDDSAADTIIGGAGADTIAGGAGADSLSGGDDADIFLLTDGFGSDTILGGEGGIDDDVIDLSTLTGPVTVTYSGDEAGTITDGTDTVTFSEVERIIGTASDDSIDGSADGAGLDIVAGDGADTILSGSGADSLDLGTGDDFVQSSSGADTISGGAGHDRVNYWDSDSGVNIDLSDGTAESGGHAAGDSLSGVDQIDGSNSFGDTIIADDSGMQVYGHGGDDSLVGGSGVDSLAGGDGNDTLEGGAGADTLEGGAGNDSILGNNGGSGADGADQIDGGAGDDTISGDLGDDTILGGAGNDAVEGAEGADSILGGAGDDYLAGYDVFGLGSSAATGNTNPNVSGDDGSADTIQGGDGSDTILGGGGADSLSGDADADTFAIQDGFGNDTIVGGESVTTGTDYDTIDLSALTGPVTVTFTGTGAGTITDGTDTITFSEIERIIGTNQADVIDASADTAGIVIVGGDGNDTITGGSGGDTIDGGAGADSILGGSGNDDLGYAVGGDTIDGQSGDDTLYGGFSAGADDAVLIGGDGNDSIITYGADDTVFGGDGSDTINADSGNEFLDGGAGDDVIYAKLGDDTIVGGTGNDSIETNGGNDVIVLADGSGNDTIADFDTGDDNADGQYNDQFDVSGMTADDGSPLRSYDVSTTDDAGNARLNFPASTSNATVTMQGTSTAQMDEGSEYQAAGIPCFTLGTLIATVDGEVPVEVLRPGDLVLTKDNGPQPLLWSAMRRLDRSALEVAPHLKPIEIAAGAFGNERALIVSPQHGVLVTLDRDEVLARARHLANLPGGLVRVRAGCRGVTYCHLFFERHEIVFSNGVPSESYFPGPEALRGLEVRDRVRLQAIAPDLPDVSRREQTIALYGSPARAYARQRGLPEHVRDLGRVCA